MREVLPYKDLNPLSAKLTKWPNTLKQFVGNLPTNCLSVFGHFVGLALKELTWDNLKVINVFVGGKLLNANTSITLDVPKYEASIV